MDVVFNEDTTFFNSEFHREYQKEILTLVYDEDDNQDVGNMDLSGMTLNQSGYEHLITEEVSDEHPIIEEVVLSPTQLETEFLKNMALSPVDISHQSLPEDVLEPHIRQLSQHHTKGIHKATYEPELSSKVKYLRNHYVSNQCLS
ncbi:Uncharacterized protein Adt_42590 [Abeliophyllum distichum]|uniref:Uncharacterized protein n=1 Tax=Abeliophyllum distichum TaxID=126358 RepID=A0ABD1PSY4_9LAMI